MTGGTGVLGSSIVKGLCSIGQHKILCSYRSIHKAHELLLKLKEQRNFIISPQFFELDLTSFNEEVRLPYLGGCTPSTDITLINNAAVCIHGSSFSSMQQSLVTNTLYPILFARQVIEFASANPEKHVRVIHVSSGDGEIAYINSQIASRISSIDNLNSLLQYCTLLQDSFDPMLEYAFGPTPLYSLSKCLLTHSTPLLQAIAPSNVKVISWCPGDFISPMTSDDEREHAVQAGQVFPHLWDLVTDPIQAGQYKGGKLYRMGQEIPF